MTKNKWHLHRAGILNFWCYDEEELEFAHGKLLLRGANGCGKSVTMQSLITVLLDGRKSPDRLDPFGSRSRRMEDYLLGEKGVSDREERTGYLYLEYKRENLEQYLTTGIGLRARRNSSLEAWYFVITDNRRIGRDLLLYETAFSLEDGRKQKIPLSRKQLVNAVGDSGHVVRTQKEYMNLVNRYLFGFEDLDAFDELVKLLIQLRSPKLSKDFKPTVIYEILTDSLPALSDEELRPLTDTIESMDQTQQQLEQLVKEQKSLKRLCSQYDRYNQYILAEKAEGLQKTKRSMETILTREQEIRMTLEQKKAEQLRLSRQKEELAGEKTAIEEEEKSLRKHEAFDAQEEKVDLENKIALLERAIKERQEGLEKKERKQRSCQEEISAKEKLLKDIEGAMLDLLDKLESTAQAAGFTGHELIAGEFRNHYAKDYGFELWKRECRDYTHCLENVLKTLRQQTAANNKYKEAEEDLAGADKELALAVGEEKKWQDFFEEEKAGLLARFHQWIKDCCELSLSPEQIQAVSQRIMLIFENYQGEEVKEPVRAAYEKISGAVSEELNLQEHKISLVKKEISDAEKEQQEWKQKKEPQPERQPDTVREREELAAKGIPHVPFYSAVEFCDHVSEAQRDRLEAAITQMGLLDALIVPETFSGQVNRYDKVIKPDPQMFGYSLADFLYPTPVEESGVSAGDIDNVLRSILIDETASETGSAMVREDGSYRLSLIKGHASEAKSIFIGQEARRLYRLRMIENLQNRINDLEQEVRLLEEGRSVLLEQKELLLAEYRQFPSLKDARTAFDTLQTMKLTVAQRSKEVERKNDLLKAAYSRLQEIRNQLRLLTLEIKLPATEEAYYAAKQQMQTYAEHLHEEELKYKDYTNTGQILFRLQGELAELAADIEALRTELKERKADLEIHHLGLKRVIQLLEELGAEEIQARMNVVLQRLKAIPDEQIKLEGKFQNNLRDITEAEKDLSTACSNLEFTRMLYGAWQAVFAEDLQLNYVAGLEEDEASGKPANEAGLVKKARDVLRFYGRLLQDKALDRGVMEDRLNQTFYQEQGVLVEYRLTREGSPGYAELPEAQTPEQVSCLEQLRRKSRRNTLLMEYEGKKVDVYYVLGKMDKDIELQKMILNDKDRELYEEVILNSVGRVIKHRINRAEEWVKRINQLMQQRDTSSGLTFSIQWKPRTADSEEEMDTKDLVDLLRSDPQLLKEQDVERITRHFRSRVNQAKEFLSEEGYGESFHKVIKEMLDFRGWFLFTLYYRREGEAKRELTNNVFYTFSGGEKAMAMYIPLFSAAYSRYLETREDAPYIISLDEAFAGVDENNIRDMFELVGQLGFDYIMNSQSLWGDYDTVDSLSICELVRPKNAPYVSVVRYYWDGAARHMLHQGENIHEIAAGQ